MTRSWKSKLCNNFSRCEIMHANHSFKLKRVHTCTEHTNATFDNKQVPRAMRWQLREIDTAIARGASPLRVHSLYATARPRHAIGWRATNETARRTPLPNASALGRSTVSSSVDCARDSQSEQLAARMPRGLAATDEWAGVGWVVMASPPPTRTRREVLRLRS